MTTNSSTSEQAKQRAYESPNYPASRRANNEPPKLAETAQDALECFQSYAKERPDVVAMCCLGVGFILGWKMKPW